MKRSLAHLTTMTKAHLNFLCGLPFYGSVRSVCDVYIIHVTHNRRCNGIHTVLTTATVMEYKGTVTDEGK